MKLTPVETERLLLFTAAELARKRWKKGLKLNHPEAVALISDEMIEAVRAGSNYDEATEIGYTLLNESDVMDGVAELVDRIQVEPLFEEGSALITLHFPIKNTARPRDTSTATRDTP